MWATLAGVTGLRAIGLIDTPSCSACLNPPHLLQDMPIQMPPTLLQRSCVDTSTPLPITALRTQLGTPIAVPHATWPQPHHAAPHCSLRWVQKPELGGERSSLKIQAAVAARMIGLVMARHQPRGCILTLHGLPLGHPCDRQQTVH